MKKARRESEKAAKAASQARRAKAAVQVTRSKKLVMYTGKGNKTAAGLLLASGDRNRSSDVRPPAGRLRLLRGTGATGIRAVQAKTVKKPRSLVETIMTLTRAEVRAMSSAERDPNRPTRKLSPRL
ncbi:hypothetical protein [Streptomyces sp. cf124]|uniref:hypothetical protein n=1 Tax=Streptomyces sp. cf124 TaxID=1761903 RepID=UPI0011606A6B|nr:hypothetical protein [Streptomyces sp. cf124]